MRERELGRLAQYIPAVVQAVAGPNRTVYAYFTDGTVHQFDVKPLIQRAACSSALRTTGSLPRRSPFSTTRSHGTSAVLSIRAPASTSIRSASTQRPSSEIRLRRMAPHRQAPIGVRACVQSLTLQRGRATRTPDRRHSSSSRRPSRQPRPQAREGAPTRMSRAPSPRDVAGCRLTQA